MRFFTLLWLLVISIPSTAASLAPRPAPNAAARGLGINVPLAARLVGGGNTLYVTSLDVSNHATTGVQADFYFDGVDSATQQPVTITGSITNAGVGAQGSGQLAGRSSVHLADFFTALVAAQMLPQTVVDHGVIGSVLVVFNNLTKSGQASVTARFSNALAGGTVGVALRGREITASEPQRLSAFVRDSRGNGAGLPEIYPNMFLNHIGLTSSGQPSTSPVQVELTATANGGQSVGTPLVITINSGHTVTVGSVLQALQVPAGMDTILVNARVISGNGAIHGIVSLVDATTRDGSVFEMNRADF